MLVYLLPIAAIGLLLIQLLRFLVASLISPLRAVPGPFLARFTDLWYLWKVHKGGFEHVNIQLHREHGDVVRYGRNRYSLNDPEAAKIVYGLGNHFPKSPWYATWSSPGQWSLFGDQSIGRHAHNRKLYQATYAMSALVHYEPFVDQCADLFSQRLSEMAKADLPIDMRHWFQCYAFDVIGLITYAKRLGFLDRGDDVGGVIHALEDHLGYATQAGIYPWSHRFLFPLKNYLAGAKGAGRAYVLRFTQERIQEVQATPKAMATTDLGPPAAMEDFLTKFLAKHSASPDVFTQYHVLSGCTSNMVAGSDTTAISLSAILYYLLKYPATLQRLREEIEKMTEQEGASTYITFKESQQMSYLQAVIKEALRMHPATGLPLERVIPEGGTRLSDRFFPEGTIVGVNTWVAHRDHRIFGDDADTFKPERWLTEDAERLSTMNRCWMPFGLGSRTCIGRHVSMLEMSKLIPRLVRDFDFELDGALRWEDWQTQNYWFVKPLDFRVRVRPRRAVG